ncbi:MAG TPA: recombinase family protein [Acidimicrobiales bacterium]|jgi:DNA invertase Pin-like site-specific DNA recombinase|nr:recombinase family protein [Acidimicrobiales bacterium]
MPPPSRAAIYARISLDAEGEGKGVKRQLEDCRRLAAELGWTVADEYVDNDISAYTGKRRPAYERMLAAIQSGTADAVLVYNLDRLTRRPIEFETFNEIATRAGVPLRCVTGDMDIGTEDGLMMGRIQAAFAAKESAAKSRRQKRKNDERAAAGIPHGGSQRPFGFEADGITHRPAEAKVIRTLSDRYLAGESLRSLANWLDAEGIKTVNGGPWRTHVIRLKLLSPRTAGLREHRGVVVGPAVWKPIITHDMRDQLVSAFEQRKASGRRTPHRYLLSGMLRCSKCDSPLYSQARETTRRYVCTSGPDHGGCGGITVVADPVEELIADSVLFRLDTPELAQALEGKARQDVETAELAESISADRQQLEELARMLARRELPMSEWTVARTIIEKRKKDSEVQLRRATDTHELAAVIGQGKALSAQWSALNLGRQSVIVKALLDHAVILPGTRGVRALDPARVRPVWRL